MTILTVYIIGFVITLQTLLVIAYINDDFDNYILMTTVCAAWSIIWPFILVTAVFVATTKAIGDFIKRGTK